MEFIFAIISLVAVVGMFITIFFITHDDWEDTKMAIRRHFQDEIVGALIVLVMFMLAITIWFGLCAFNNTFWHMDYSTTDDVLWKKNDKVEEVIK